MYKVVFYRGKEIAREVLHNQEDEKKLTELLEFHNKVMTDKNISYDNSKKLEYYSQIIN